MFRFFRRHKTVVLVSLAIVAIVLPFLGVGSNSLIASPQDVVAKINGRNVTQGEYDRVFNQMSRQKGALTPAQRQQLAKEALDDIVRHDVFSQEAERYGLRISDHELQLQLSGIPAFQKDKHFDPQTYAQVVYQTIGTTPRDFEKGFRQEIEARKLNQLIGSTVHVSDEDFQNELNARLSSEKDKDALKKLKENPEALRAEIRTRETNLVFRDWLNQLNASLKVNIVSDTFRKRMAGTPQ